MFGRPRRPPENVVSVATETKPLARSPIYADAVLNVISSRNTVGPSSVRCSLKQMACRLGLPSNLASRRLRSISGKSRQVVTVMLDQIEGEQHCLELAGW